MAEREREGFRTNHQKGREGSKKIESNVYSLTYTVICTEQGTALFRFLATAGYIFIIIDLKYNEMQMRSHVFYVLPEFRKCTGTFHGTQKPCL